MTPRLQLLRRLGRLLHMVEGGPRLGGIKDQWKGLVGRTARSVGLPKGQQTLREATKSFVKHPIQESRGAWTEMSPTDKAVYLGLSGLEVPQAIRARTPEEKGRAAGSLISGTAGWFGLRKVPLVGQLLGWGALSQLGEGAGARIGRAIGSSPKSGGM